ncbi:fumarylacetoacetate hydrolase family protein [Aeromicrobium sp. CF3.5]|uniref:fumarylacetoacetate hydrolase family protein n=1 Tax=Aeromicrobium sp. CF3.5 TaxID=3373078 RepID=UPI003EE71F4B
MSVRLVGYRGADEVTMIGSLTQDGAEVIPLAGLEEFWSDPRRFTQADVVGLPAMSTTEVLLVPPVLPGARVICIGLNYMKHVAEGSYAAEGVPPHPTLFARWPTSLAVDGAEIPVPADEDGLDWEGEVVAYVGATLSEATPEEALSAVVGYSTFNDITARRAQKLTSQWTLGKNADRSGPLGPLVPTEEVGDLRDGLEIRTRVNGELVQEGSTDEMVYTVGETLSFISRTFTLNPGDLLATGTPAGVGYSRTPPWLMEPGDVVEVEVDRLGVLRNTIIAGA